MPAFAPDFLAGCSGGRWNGLPERPVTGVSIDSRTLEPGDLFVALRTAKRDGHAFLAAAAARGAPAALVAVPQPAAPLATLEVPDPAAALLALARHHRARFPGTVVGVTGSAGKTSTKNLAALLLGGAPRVLATAGNLNNHLGVPLTLLRLDPAVHTHAVVEAGLSHPGDIELLGPVLDADHAIITLIAPAHLEGMGTLAGIAREKAALLRRARPGGFAVVPASAAVHAPLRDHALRTVVVAGPDDAPAGAEVFWRSEDTLEATLLHLRDGAGPERTFPLPPVSAGQASNAALALTLAARLGVADDALAERLRGWRPAALRAEWHATPAGPLFLDCYNANPASLADALAFFARRAPPALPRLFLVGCFGELGAEAARLHREAGRGVPLRAFDRLVAVGDHADEIVAGAREAGAAAAQVEAVAEAGDALVRLAAFRGALFVKGSRRWALETVVARAPHGAELGTAAGEAAHAAPC